MRYLGQTAHTNGSLYRVGPPQTPLAEKINRYNSKLLGEITPQLLRRGYRMVDIDFFCAEAMIAFITKEIDYLTRREQLSNATDEQLNQLYETLHKELLEKTNGTR